jgi:hypothetical protein
MYRKQRSPNPGGGGAVTEGGFGYKGGQSKPKVKHTGAVGGGAGTGGVGGAQPSYYPKQPPQLQAVPRRF